MSAKRNDPCKCGSGKKFKKCCMLTASEQLNSKKLHGCLKTLCPILQHYSTQRFGETIRSAGWHEFSRWGTAAVAHEKQAYQRAFIDWWLFAWLPDDRESADEKFLLPAPDHAIAADYLSVHRANLTPLEQNVIEKALMSPYSFYTLLSFESGNHMRVQEIYTQEQISVERPTGFPLAPGDLLYTAVLSVNGVSILLGCMPQTLDVSNRITIETHRNKWQAETGKTIDRRLLYLHDTELRRFYFILLAQKQQVNLH